MTKHRLACIVFAVALPGLAFAACSGESTVEATDGTKDGQSEGSDEGADTSAVKQDAPADSSMSDTAIGVDSATDADGAAGDVQVSDASPEAGTDSGSDGDAGTDASDGGITDAGGDAATDASLGDAGDGGDGGEAEAGCATSARMCTGDQPLICTGGTWVNNGGVCSYGCMADAGACSCSAPAGRLTVKTIGVVTTIDDSVTTFGWFTQTTMASISQSSAAWYCAAAADAGIGSYAMPTVAKVNTLLAQQVTDKFCTPDNDPAVNSSDVVWTQDACGVGMHKTVSLNDGTIACEADGLAHRGWCVK
jgi:hypothetical protein